MSIRMPGNLDLQERGGVPLVNNNRPNGGNSGIFMSVLGFVLILTAFVPGILGVAVSFGMQAVLVVLGAVLLVLGLVITTITRLYHRTSADVAFVRTGMGGPKVVIDGGLLVIPVAHQLTRVSLRTMRIDVTRDGQQALLTRDFLRADIKVGFFIKVPKDSTSVITASTTLGEGASNEQYIRNLIQEKLDSALRQASVEMDLQALLIDRARFIQAVTQHVAQSITSNGLSLEDVVISQLDQTNASALRGEDNIFDAQGSRKIVEIVSQQKVARTQAQLAAERDIQQRTVETNKFLFEQNVANAEAEAERDRKISMAKAEAAQVAASNAAEQDRLAKLAEVERDREVQLAQTNMAKALDVATQQREEAVRQAEIAKNKAIEVSEREKDAALAAKQAEVAQAEADRQSAEAKAERERQAVITVQVTAKAERDKQQSVINAQAAAETRRVEEQMKADVEAYSRIKAAEAEQTAAVKASEALLIRAEAEQKARSLEAQGMQATQMVPVEVERKRVEVRRAEGMISVDVAAKQVEVSAAQVEVLKRELEAKSAHQEISRELELRLAEIEAGKATEISRAEAIGKALASANMTIWSDPEAFARMSESFLKGQQTGQVLRGLVNTSPIEAKAGFSALGQMVQSFLQANLGTKVDSVTLQKILEALANNANDGSAKV